MFLAWTAGLNWHSLQRPLYLLAALVLLLTGAGCLWLGITLRNVMRERRVADEYLAATGWMKAASLQEAKRKAGIASRYLSLAVLSLSIGATFGWLWRDHELTSPVKPPYLDVLVTHRYDDTHFELEPVRMRPWKATTCLPVDWQAGQKMMFLVYRQHLGCKDVTVDGWYQFYTDELTGERINFKKELANVGGY